MQISYKGKDSLYGAMRKEAQSRLFLAISGSLISIFLLLQFNSERIFSFLAILALIFFISLTINTLKRLRNKNYSCKLALEQKPKSIVWVYSVKTQRLPFGISVSDEILLYFKTVNKKEFSIKVKEKELSEIMAFLNGLLPQATFGYSLDKDQWYEADPHLLLKD